MGLAHSSRNLYDGVAGGMEPHFPYRGLSRSAGRGAPGQLNLYLGRLCILKTPRFYFLICPEKDYFSLVPDEAV